MYANIHIYNYTTSIVASRVLTNISAASNLDSDWTEPRERVLVSLGCAFMLPLVVGSLQYLARQEGAREVLYS